MPRHFLDLEGAATVATEPLRLTHRAVADLRRAHAMGVVHGDAGLGKTFAVEDAMLTSTQMAEACWTSVGSRLTLRQLTLDLLGLLTRRQFDTTRHKATYELIEILAERPRLLILDESQRLSSDGIELLRHLHDHPATQFALLLVGGNGCWEVLSREPMLRSRIYRRIHFQPLSPQQVPRSCPAITPSTPRPTRTCSAWSMSPTPMGTGVRGRRSPAPRWSWPPRPAASACSANSTTPSSRRWARPRCCLAAPTPPTRPPPASMSPRMPTASPPLMSASCRSPSTPAGCCAAGAGGSCSRPRGRWMWPRPTWCFGWRRPGGTSGCRCWTRPPRSCRRPPGTSADPGAALLAWLTRSRWIR